jgi:hypothetical protein
MADAHPPPNLDTTFLDALDPTIRDFLATMQATGSGTASIDAASRKQYSYKVSLYLSVDDPHVPLAVRNAFALFLNELSKLKGTHLLVTNCNDEPLLVPHLLQDDGFKELTGWEIVKPTGKRQNVYICVKIKSSIAFSRFKHRMIQYLQSSKTLMKRNHSLGDSSEEMATIGYLSPVHPEILLGNLQTELNKEIQCINAQHDDDFLFEYGMSRGVLGEIVIAHGAVRGSSKQLGDIVNSKAVIVECPKSKASFYLRTIQDALLTFQWSPDLKKVKFVPFGLKVDSKTTEIFTKMIVYNSVENDKKAYSQILGVSRDDMEGIRDLLITDGPGISHIAPTTTTDKQGRWKIFTRKDNLDSLDKWLTDNLPRIVTSLDMRIPVPGFEIPRLFLSNRPSASLVTDFEAIAMTIPLLDDASAFPHLVVRKPRNANSHGAWTSGPTIVTAASTLTPATPATNRRVITQPNATSPPSTPAFNDILLQLAENREYRKQLDASREIDKAEQRSFRATLHSISETIENDRLVSQQQHAQTTLVLEQLTDGHTELNLTIEAEVKALRHDISKLSDMVLALLQQGAPVPLSTPPRIQWTDSDNSASIIGLPLAVAKKRAPDRTPNTPNPSVTKTSRRQEGMDTDVSQSARQP